MSLPGRVHGRLVHPRRVEVLCGHIAPLIPPGAQVLDVGTGDGLLAKRLSERRPDLRLTGVDVQPRPNAHIDVTAFDGRRLPFPDKSFDVVLFVDVLHHASDPTELLREGRRTARLALIIKDHLLQGVGAGPMLRLMDVMGNARFGVSLPHNYWTPEQWRAAFAEIGLHVTATLTRLGLYPRCADWLFGRSLHFISRVSPAGSADDSSPAHLIHWDTAVTCCNEAWERGYARFETPAQEIAKFVRRLRALGASDWPREARIVELFCGRGGGLAALERLGFRHLEGVDLSPSLLGQYRGPATLYVGDSRRLRLPDASRDIIIVHGGLHHLPRIPDDLETVLTEAHRVLASSGRFVFVEPWETPFLRGVHAACDCRPLRKAVDTIDALATMIDEERQTYHAWLHQPEAILSRVHRLFIPERQRIGWGKIQLVGRKRGTPGTMERV